MNFLKGYKGFVCGLLVGTLGITTVFAAGGIKSATFNANKVIFNGSELNLKGQQMISVVKDGEYNASNYMPVRAVLEAMGYKVDWDGSRNAVVVSSNGLSLTEPIVNTPIPQPTPTTSTTKNLPAIFADPNTPEAPFDIKYVIETTFSLKGGVTPTAYIVFSDEPVNTETGKNIHSYNPKVENGTIFTFRVGTQVAMLYGVEELTYSEYTYIQDIDAYLQSRDSFEDMYVLESLGIAPVMSADFIGKWIHVGISGVPSFYTDTGETITLRVIE